MAVYNLLFKQDIEDVKSLVDEAIRRRQKLEIHEVKAVRTLAQNNYLHFTLSYFASQYGCTASEAKEIHLKHNAAPHIFLRERVNPKGRTVQYARSTKELSREEMFAALTNFKEYAAQGGISIPDPSEIRAVERCKREIERCQWII